MISGGAVARVFTFPTADPRHFPSSSVWVRLVSHVFFLLFTSPILSPSISEKTIYLYWFVPLLDIHFLLYCVQQMRRAPMQAVIATASLIVWFGFTSPVFAARWVSILWPLAYLVYSYERGIFYLYIWMAFNIFVVFAQALAYFGLGHSAANAIGPNNISAMLWGQFATRAHTNFYSIVPKFDVPRFSGLSREGGFFAALLAGVVLLRTSSKQKVGLLFMAGIALSLSKTSALLVIGWVLTLIAARDKRTPPVFFLPFFLLVCLLYYLTVDDELMSGVISGTFTHRFFSYSALFHDMDLGNLIAGNKASDRLIVQFKSFQLCSNLVNFVDCLDMNGFPAIIFISGIVGLCLYLWQLAAFGMSVWGVMLVFFLTIDVSPLTSTSFVVLAYFLGLKASGALNKRSDLVTSSASVISASGALHVA